MGGREDFHFSTPGDFRASEKRKFKFLNYVQLINLIDSSSRASNTTWVEYLIGLAAEGRRLLRIKYG